MASARAGGLPLCALLWCTACSEEGASARKPSSAPAAASPSTRVGIRVPLPPDWEARQGADGELRVGPTGKPPILRIARRPASAPESPSLEALRSLLPAQTQPKADAVRDTRDARILTYPVDSTGRLFGLIGARGMREDWMLCAATRALEPSQLESAIDACAGLTVAGNERERP